MYTWVGTWDFGRNLKYKNEWIRRIHGLEPGTSEGTCNTKKIGSVFDFKLNPGLRKGVRKRNKWKKPRRGG
jgi:hypothetical protein